jgi:cholest-4-en-3-one 26-monooxygenase
VPPRITRSCATPPPYPQEAPPGNALDNAADPVQSAGRVTTRAPLESLELIDPALYERSGYPHAAWQRLRREAPVYFSAHTEPPFWALVRRAEIAAVSREPQRFRSWPRFQLVPGPQAEHDGLDTTTLISMDPPRHRPHRLIASPHFTPRALQPLYAGVEQIAGQLLDGMQARGGSACDFVEAFAAPLPIAVIAHLLDVPHADWPALYDWTNRMIGANDPQYRDAHASAGDTRRRAIAEIHGYFRSLLQARRRAPASDLVSLLAHAELGGCPLDDADVLAYCLILVVAGNETTRNAISGGLLALLEHPEQWKRLQAEPGLLDRAVEEVLRWTTPVVQMARTAAEDVELCGARIRAGDLVVMFYASANRDEAVFESPEVFDVGRAPNPHLAFGIGEHVCMGAHLARLELRAALHQLLRRIDHAELAGPVERLRSSMVGGIKRLPVRLALRRAQGGPA